MRDVRAQRMHQRLKPRRLPPSAPGPTHDSLPTTHLSPLTTHQLRPVRNPPARPRCAGRLCGIFDPFEIGLDQSPETCQYSAELADNDVVLLAVEAGDLVKQPAPTSGEPTQSSREGWWCRFPTTPDGRVVPCARTRASARCSSAVRWASSPSPASSADRAAPAPCGTAAWTPVVGVAPTRDSVARAARAPCGAASCGTTEVVAEQPTAKPRPAQVLPAPAAGAPGSGTTRAWACLGSAAGAAEAGRVGTAEVSASRALAVAVMVRMVGAPSVGLGGAFDGCALAASAALSRPCGTRSAARTGRGVTGRHG